VIGSIYFGVRATRDEIRNQLSAVFDASSLDRAAELARTNLQTRQFANYLHGQVQNKLLGIALRIEAGEISDDRSAIEEADSVIRSLESELGSQPPKSIEDELARISEQWRGFAVITFEIKPESNSMPPDLTETLSQVCEEAVANAVRHGHARSIHLECRFMDGYVQVYVDDDGLGPRRGRKGLGSRYFDAIAKFPWSLTERPSGGSRLDLKVDLLGTR
jgi:signal transduction histidine kinase